MIKHSLALLASVGAAGAAGLAHGEVTTAKAQIEVTGYTEALYDEAAGGTSLYELTITETFSGDIEAEGQVRFLQARSADGASFTGIERVTGSIGGRKGSFLLQDTGTLVGTAVTGTWFVVPGSGTGDLAGLKGSGGFRAELGQHADVTLDYSFE